MSEERVTRTLKEIKREANYIYDDLMEYLKREHGSSTSLAIQIATGAITLKMWKNLVLENDNENEKQLSEEIMDRLIEYVLIHRIQRGGEE